MNAHTLKYLTDRKWKQQFPSLHRNDNKRLVTPPTWIKYFIWYRFCCSPFQSCLFVPLRPFPTFGSLPGSFTLTGQNVLDLHRCDQMVSFQLGFYVDEEDRNTGSRASTEWWLHWCVKNKKYYPCTVSTRSVAHALIPSNTSPEMLRDFAKNTLHTLKDVTSVQMIQGATKRRRRWK